MILSRVVRDNVFSSAKYGSVSVICVIMFSYAEYIVINDVSNVIKVPEGLSLDVAATLPCGALTAYAAVQRVLLLVEKRLHNSSG